MSSSPRNLRVPRESSGVSHENVRLGSLSYGSEQHNSPLIDVGRGYRAFRLIILLSDRLVILEPDPPSGAPPPVVGGVQLEHKRDCRDTNGGDPEALARDVQATREVLMRAGTERAGDDRSAYADRRRDDIEREEEKDDSGGRA